MDLVLDKPGMTLAARHIQPTLPAAWVATTDPLWDEYWEKVKDQPLWGTPTDADIAEAKRLMKDAGYEDGFKDVDFMVRDNPLLNLWAPIIQDTLKRNLNIGADIRTVTRGVSFEELERGNFDMAYGLLNASLGHVGDYWVNWHATDGGFNLVGYSNPEFDAVVAAASAESDPAKLRELIFKGVDILDQDVPQSVFSTLVVTDAWWDDVKGHQTATKGVVYWEGMKNATWWLDR